MQQFFLSIHDCNTSPECFLSFDSSNCLIGLFCSIHHDTLSRDLSTKVISNELFNYLCAFYDIWRVSIATKPWNDYFSLKEKDIFFWAISAHIDIDISAKDILILRLLFCQTVKRQLVTLKKNCPLNTSVQRQLCPNISCLLDDPWKVTDHTEHSPTTLEIGHDWVLMLAETVLKVSKRSVSTLN